jgi:ABC-type Fe3+-siderophore transport system permease subunit
MAEHVLFPKRHYIFWFVFGGGLFLLLLVSLVGLRLGAVHISFPQIIREFYTGKGFVVDYRLPRIMVAILVGMNMAVAGFILQGVTKNPLAAPDLMGVTAGGGLASVILILTVPTFHPMLLPVYAFAGALATSLFVFVIALKQGRLLPERLALCGIAVGGAIHAFITLLIVTYSPNAAQALVWLKGSLYARSWQHVEMLLPWTLVCMSLAILAYRQINLFALEEETICSLGMNIDRARLLLLLLAIGLAGSSVAVAGTIGFIGLVVPHLSRLLVGVDARYVLPVSAVLGALLVVVSDVVGRSIFPPAEIPVGILTSLLGAPYFMYLLLRQRVT